MKFAVLNEAHIIALPCVETADDIHTARKILNELRGHQIRIYAKI